MTASKWLAICVTCLVGASQSHAEGSEISSYFCVVEASGGVAYNTNMKKWVGMTFNPHGKFVLRLRQLGRRSERNVHGKDEAVTEYSISLTESGSSTARRCEKIGSVDPTVAVYDDRAIHCADGTTDYMFDITANRFLASDMRGYVFGKKQNGEDYPSISAGTCTRIE